MAASVQVVINEPLVVNVTYLVDENLIPVWLGIWLQSGCFWLFLPPFLPFLPFWLAVWLRCFCSLALFCCSLAFFSEPDCKSGARLQNNGARLQVREPDCKKKEPDCKKTAVRLFAVRLHLSLIHI